MPFKHTQLALFQFLPFSPSIHLLNELRKFYIHRAKVAAVDTIFTFTCIQCMYRHLQKCMYAFHFKMSTKQFKTHYRQQFNRLNEQLINAHLFYDGITTALEWMELFWWSHFLHCTFHLFLQLVAFLLLHFLRFFPFYFYFLWCFDEIFLLFPLRLLFLAFSSAFIPSLYVCLSFSLHSSYLFSHSLRLYFSQVSSFSSIFPSPSITFGTILSLSLLYYFSISLLFFCYFWRKIMIYWQKIVPFYVSKYKVAKLLAVKSTW